MNGVFGRRDRLVNGLLFAVYYLPVPWVIGRSLLDTFIITYRAKRYSSALIGIAVHSAVRRPRCDRALIGAQGFEPYAGSCRPHIVFTAIHSMALPETVRWLNGSRLCGAKLPPTCGSCGAENRTGAKFCDSCGAAFGADAAVGVLAEAKANDSPIRVADTRERENIEGERKTVTTLFADIKGSMELIEDLDPEEARAIVDPALKLMMEAVHRFGGYVLQSTGDDIFALFGAPATKPAGRV